MDPNLLDKNHRPPLFRAINENRPECIKILLEFGANIQISIDKKHSTPLHLAINCGEKQIVKILLDNGARPEESDSEGITPLMLTTKHDHASLIPLLMSYGIALSKVDNAKNTVFHHAVMNGAVKCMEYLIKRMGKMVNIGPVEQLFDKRNNENKNAFDIGIEEKRETILAIVISYAPENYFRDHSTILHKIYDRRMYCTLKAILERMVVVEKDRVKMSPKFLDSNELGQYPSDPKFKHMIPSFLHKLLICPDTELKYHPIVAITINRKLAVYRWWYIFSLIFYLFFLFALMFALIQASYLCDEKLWDYSTSLDAFRVICEIFCVLCWVLFLLDEMIEFLIEWVQIKHKKVNKKQNDQIDFTLAENSTKYLALLNLIHKFCNGHKIFEKVDRILYCLLSALINYFISFNLIDSGALLCFFILIILRVVGSYFQWSFASITFVLFSLRLFKYTRIIPSLGAYVHSVFRVFVKDIPRFIVIIIIISISYVGGIHLAARQQPYRLNRSSLSLSDQQCTRTETQLLWFNSESTLGYDLRSPLVSSIIFLLDGGPGNFEQNLLNVNFLFTVLYLLFAFTIIVVLLNILIAQLSETYSEIIKTDEFHYLMELVVNLELKSNLAFITGKIFRKYNTYDTIELSINMWRELRHLCPGNDIEIQIDEINGKVDNNGELIKTEAQKTVINHEWIQENISEIRDTVSHISSVINHESSLNDVTKTIISDETIISRISKIEVEMNNQSQILQSILETIKRSS